MTMTAYPKFRISPNESASTHRSSNRVKGPFAAIVTYLAGVLVIGCGGGGGGDGSDNVDLALGRAFTVIAPVVNDTCGERLSAVQQRFILQQTDQGVFVDTSLVKVELVQNETGYEGGFAESNGDCAREYSIHWSDIEALQPEVTLKSRSTCSAQTCETSWKGIATPEDSADRDNETFERVRGENCNPNVPTSVGFRASCFECNGNAAVLLSAEIRKNHSVVVRRDGQFNDRDPANPSCDTNRCSPYKTQKRLELPAYQVNCLGDSGFSANFALVNRISIKFVASVTDANDTRQFEQYCLASTTEPSN